MAYLLKSLLLSSFVSRVQASWAEAFGPANQKPIGGEGRGRPNIVFVLTDDQDLHMQSLDYMPFVQQHLIDQGGYPKFISQGLNDKYLPVWLQSVGYNTYYTGKLFNAHAVDNYDSPFAADPFTYWYMNSTYQRNRDPPVSYEGQHSVDVLAKKAIGLLDEAYDAGKPFFLGLAPVAPHADIQSPAFKHGNHSNLTEVKFSPPVPAKRHAHLFQDARVPRTPNFNPDKPSGASWIRNLRKQDPDVIEYNDHSTCNYSTDNGYHIGQHRLHPSKQCSFEEDINIPLIIRGPGVPKGAATDIVTTHTDLAPTILQIAGAPLRDDFDGLAIPLTQAGLDQAKDERHEHVTVEHWGFGSNEGLVLDQYPRLRWNNTYKAMRVIGKSYNLHYQVWCNNEHELHDLTTDPGQMVNLLHPDEDSTSMLLGLPLDKVIQRLDSLLFVLKSCRAQTCIHPWRALHPGGNVETLQDALSPRFDSFYAARTKSIGFDRCESGYILDAEGEQYEQESLESELRRDWHEWT
ncbi:hypothetical protein CIB48_g5621 [Xylaria polymorpha]|nr:hypothetical protein CIB48_g5621 [Xylaria polymorpha]